MSLNLRSLSLASAALLLAGCSTLGWPPGSVSTRIDPVTEPGVVSLHCLASSTGACHFLLGEAWETHHEVRQGQVLKIPAPQQALPICATHAAGFRLLCTRKTTLGPGATMTFQTASLG